MLSFRDSPRFDQESALVLLTSEQVKSHKFPFGNKALAEAIKQASLAKQFEGAKSELFPILIGGRVVLLSGLGKEKDLTLTTLRVYIRRALLSPFLKKTKKVEIVLHADSLDIVKAALEAVVIGTYAWKKYVAKPKDDKTVEDKSFIIATSRGAILSDALLAAECANYARDLVNDNADLVTAVYLEKKARELVRGKKNIALEILDRKKLAAKKFGLLLAVNQGSNKEPRVVIVKYTGAGKGKPYTALVGKGLTYDSGGLNLKPTGSMETMRTDMSGAAAVLGTLKAVLTLKPKKNLIFAMGMAENAIDANSYKPGDVIVGFAGKSVEIGNTDAEGRLVLADVMAYVVKNYKPAKLIDLATLTGACVVALGHDYAALISNNDPLAKAILQSAEATDDRAWQLPNYPELKDAMKSKIADIKNTSNYRGAAGTLTGAEFLRQFIGDTPWAHLDIAGTAFVDNDSRLYYGHGATGYGVRLLVHYILNY